MDNSFRSPHLTYSVAKNLMLGLFIGACSATFFVYIGQIDPAIALASIVAIPASLVMAKNPRILVLLCILCLLIFEEFPSAQGETFERSQRTSFYSLSLGIPGLYSTDVFLLFSLFLFLVRSLIYRESIPWVFNNISLGMVLVGLTSLVCMLNSALLNGAINFSIYYDVTLSNLGDFDQTAAALIGFFQIKLYSYLIISYLAGLYYFRSKIDLQNFLKIIALALLLNIAIGVIRLLVNPEIVSEGLPLFYHSPTSWIFSISIFYLMGHWAGSIRSPIKTGLTVLVCLILFAFILLSLRRTMWGAMFVAGLFFLFFTNADERKQLYPLLGIGICILIATLLVTPIGEAVFSRASQTNADNASSFYRLLLFVYFISNWTDIPLLGYGVEPLWNFQEASVGYFRISLENVHSLYFWILLRFGILGFVTTLFSSALVAYQIAQTLLKAQLSSDRWLIISVILALIMLLFSGLFNPVYAEARYMILTGFSLALITNFHKVRPDNTGAKQI